jgi:hypothetical protein
MVPEILIIAPFRSVCPPEAPNSLTLLNVREAGATRRY